MLDLPPGAEFIEPPPPADLPALDGATADRQRVEVSASADKPADRLGYLLALPTGYDAESTKQWPVIVFLHGIGERGDDPRRVANWGPPRLIKWGMREFPAIVISPQCPAGGWWPHKVIALSRLLDHVEARHRVDLSRVYLTGLSMGGFGAVAWAAAEPQRFAALVAVCGGGHDRFTAVPLNSLPSWFFHGEMDTVVPPKESIDLYTRHPNRRRPGRATDDLPGRRPRKLGTGLRRGATLGLAVRPTPERLGDAAISRHVRWEHLVGEAVGEVHPDAAADEVARPVAGRSAVPNHQKQVDLPIPPAEQAAR